KEAEGLAIDADHLRSECFGAAIGRDWTEWSAFILWRTVRLAKNLAGGGVKEAQRFLHAPDDFQKTQSAKRGHLTSWLDPFKTESDVALAGKVIKLVRRGVAQNCADGAGIRQVALVSQE